MLHVKTRTSLCVFVAKLLVAAKGMCFRSHQQQNKKTLTVKKWWPMKEKTAHHTIALNLASDGDWVCEVCECL